MVGDNLTDFLSKIENHVKAEQRILDAWVDKDEKIKQVYNLWSRPTRLYKKQ